MFHYKSIYSIKPTAVSWMSLYVRYVESLQVSNDSLMHVFFFFFFFLNPEIIFVTFFAFLT